MSRAKKGLGMSLLAAVAVVTAPAASAQDLEEQDLEELLQQVGPEYAEAYISPFIHAHGANQNSALYNTAAIAGTGLHISFGVKVMATNINEDDQTFRKVVDNVPLGDILPDDPIYDPWRNDTATLLLEGPTVFGRTDVNGTITAYVDGVPIYETEGIPGLVDTRWVPLFAPQVTVGTFYGVSGTLRWFPEIDLSDYGKTNFFGWGLQWGVNTVLPELPVDVMVGYFRQNLDVGDLLKTSAHSLFAAASKSFTLITLYGGLAAEKSDMDVKYTFEGVDDLVDATEIAFSVEGKQTARITLGATLNVLGGLNVEYAYGDLSTFSAGLMVGF
jgi:hypothetical protein